MGEHLGLERNKWLRDMLQEIVRRPDDLRKDSNLGSAEQASE